MADAKISALTAASTPLAGTEVLPIVQSGTTKKVAVSSLTAGRAVSTGVLTVVNGTNPYIEMPDGTGTTYIQVASGDLNFVPRSGKNVSISNSNLVISTAAKGIDFSANTHSAGMTSELLNWYEEGTFIPTLSGATTTTYTTQTGRYTRIGRQIFFHCEIEINSVGNGSTTIVLLGDLPTALGSPFSTISVGFFTGIASTVSSLTGYIGAAGANSVQFQSLLAAATSTAPNAVFANGTRVMFSGQYSV